MELVERMNIPLCQKTKIPVKTLVEQLETGPSQKKLLESHIANMYLVSLLNEQTIRIRAFKDEEHSYMAIYVFQIELKANDQLSEFCELVHSAFPESSVLLLKHKGNEYISGAMKRINKQYKTKSVVEDTVWSVIEKDDDIDIKNIPAFDLKELYESVIRIIYSLKVKRITGIYPKGEHDYKAVIKQYEVLNTDINKLKDDYKKASMRSEKLSIDDELYDKEKQLHELIASL